MVVLWQMNFEAVDSLFAGYDIPDAAHVATNWSWFPLPHDLLPTVCHVKTPEYSGSPVHFSESPMKGKNTGQYVSELFPR